MSKHSRKNKTPKHLTALKITAILVCVLFLAYTRHSIQVERNGEAFSQENIRVVLQDEEFTLSLDELLLDDIERYIPQREPFSVYGFKQWILNKDHEVWRPLINDTYLTQKISEWEQALKLPESKEGVLEIEQDGTVLFEKPQSGIGIDQKHLTNAITRHIDRREQKRDYTIFARTEKQKPLMDSEVLEEQAQDISLFMSRDLMLINTDYDISHTIPQKELPYLLSLTFNTEKRSYDIDIHTVYIAEELGEYEREMTDAGFVIESDDSVRITPSQVGLELSEEETAFSIVQAIEKQIPEARIIFETIEPDLTTKEAEALDIIHPVVSFTTYFACCEARAKNIHTVSKIVDGALVLPEETWNLNTFIGKRTPERGFLPAGTIVKGSMIETTGGGISQFATTFYNAVYWGGYKDIFHIPHSRYFPRYPEGIEATISWPEPHLIFQNNSSSGILIDTSETPTSVTVRFFGNNDGRYIRGSHKDGITTIEIVKDGGDRARIVESSVENRTDIYPQKEIYYVDETLMSDIPIQRKEGRPSYSVDILRTIRNPQGEVVESKRWKTYYLSEDKEFVVRDCSLAPPEAECKTPEILKQEKEALEAFFAELEANN